MVGYTIPKHDDAEAPFQVIMGKLLALLSLHFEFTDWHSVHACCLSCLRGFFTCLLTISCVSTPFTMSWQPYYQASTAETHVFAARDGNDMQTWYADMTDE